MTELRPQPWVAPRPVSAGWQLIGSHDALMTPLPTPPGECSQDAAVDLAVVPAGRWRPATRCGLNTVIDLARAGAVKRILVLLSKDAARPECVAELHAHLSSHCPPQVPVAVSVLHAVPAALGSFEVDRLPISSARRGNPRCLPQANDVAKKRNLALLIARRLDLRDVLFMDDDLRPVPPEWRSRDPAWAGPTLDHRSLAAALIELRTRRLAAVGWKARGYEDNSVVCRVRRLVGLVQDQFIGGGALLTTAHTAAFFPAIYNEDWLFLLALLHPDRPVASQLGLAGVVVQDEYDGYHPRRARSEELGDILGEGLMSLLHHGPSRMLANADHNFWRQVIAGRQRLIRDLLARLGNPDLGVRLPERDAAREALEAALGVHRDLEARGRFWVDQLAQYLHRWRSDLDRWAEQLAWAMTMEPIDDLLPGPTFVLGENGHDSFRVREPNRFA